MGDREVFVPFMMGLSKLRPGLYGTLRCWGTFTRKRLSRMIFGNPST